MINSAGQDNHYSDPLANMNFSARGYARLNQKLAPDIAVLEGGYSVETALPYVNMGIIMAMAGLDYSNLYEPDYRGEEFTESRGRLRRLREVVEELRPIFLNREALVAGPAKNMALSPAGSEESITILMGSMNSRKRGSTCVPIARDF